MAAEVTEGPQGTTMSWEDYLALDGFGEYIDGRFVPRTMVTSRHQRIVHRLVNLLDSVTESRVEMMWGWRPFASQTKYEPDVMVIDAVLAGKVDDSAQYWDGPVRLCVEVLSPSNQAKDWVRNTRVFAAAGCPEYWIVSPWDSSIYFFALVDGSYEQQHLLTPDAPVDLPDWNLTLTADAVFG